jgi:hypothetical protein
VLGQLINIPTDTLIDMLFVIANGEVAITANDVAEIEQIQRELQRRGGNDQTGPDQLLTETNAHQTDR